MSLARRFQASADFESNKTLSNNPMGFDRVSNEVKALVDYERPGFNWPSPTDDRSNYFALEGMAVSTLKELGYGAESRSLRARLKLMTQPYGEIQNLFHHYLDFEPAATLSAEKLAELHALAESLELDIDSIRRTSKKRVRNPLAHTTKNLKEEWAWLVEKAETTSCFGKTAACELKKRAVTELINMWLPEIGIPAKLPDTDASFGNLAWFRRAFPLGWSHIDYLGESAAMSIPDLVEFETMLAICYFELADKTSRGWSIEEARRFAFDHKSNVGINGSALLGIGAAAFVERCVMPLIESGSRAAAAPLVSGIAKHVARMNPGLAGTSEPFVLWHVYRAVDPVGCSEVELSVLNPENNKKNGSLRPKQEIDALRARLEAIELEGVSAVFWLGPESNAVLARPLAASSSMRL